MKQRTKNLIAYIVPSVFGQICFFLFTIIDGIFVGRGIGETALGAVNLCLPFVMVINALYMLITIGSVSVVAIRLGRHDDEGAGDVFMHAFGVMLTLGMVLTAASAPFPSGIAKLLGTTETYLGYVSDYLFWYSIFILPSSLNTLFQAFCRTDGSPMLVMVATVVSSLMNIFLDWLFVFPLQMGVAGAAAATGLSQALAFLIVLSHFIGHKGKLKFRKCRLQMTLIKKIRPWSAGSGVTVCHACHNDLYELCLDFLYWGNWHKFIFRNWICRLFLAGSFYGRVGRNSADGWACVWGSE